MQPPHRAGCPAPLTLPSPNPVPQLRKPCSPFACTLLPFPTPNPPLTWPLPCSNPRHKLRPRSTKLNPAMPAGCSASTPSTSHAPINTSRCWTPNTSPLRRLSSPPSFDPPSSLRCRPPLSLPTAIERAPPLSHQLLGVGEVGVGVAAVEVGRGHAVQHRGGGGAQLLRCVRSGREGEQGRQSALRARHTAGRGTFHAYGAGHSCLFASCVAVLRPHFRRPASTLFLFCIQRARTTAYQPPRQLHFSRHTLRLTSLSCISLRPVPPKLRCCSFCSG